MTRRAITQLLFLLSLVATLFAVRPVAFAQVNIAALTQFKRNQQAALAKQLQGKASAEGKAAKAAKHGKGNADVPLMATKPAIIQAEKRSFKGNYSDMRKSNMR